jgi:hypothetical protein
MTLFTSLFAGPRVQVPARGWSLEMALPLSKLIEFTTASLPLVGGTFWRINFSRVEWGVVVDPVEKRFLKHASCQSCPVPGAPTHDNWVWAPQGAVNMHQPETWGMVQWSYDKVNSTQAVFNPEWPVRALATGLYDAQVAYAVLHNNTFASELLLLRPFVSDQSLLDGSCSNGVLPLLHAWPADAPVHFLITVTAPFRALSSAHASDLGIGIDAETSATCTATVGEDRRLRVRCG